MFAIAARLHPNAVPKPGSDRMDTAFHQFDEKDADAGVLQAAVLMQRALDLLDLAGEVRAAVHLQHALDTLCMRLPGSGQPH